MASSASPIPFASTSAILQQRRVDVLVSLQKAAQEIASILELGPGEVLARVNQMLINDFLTGTTSR